jgi:hypothetical protein
LLAKHSLTSNNSKFHVKSLEADLDGLSGAVDVPSTPYSGTRLVEYDNFPAVPIPMACGGIVKVGRDAEPAVVSSGVAEIGDKDLKAGDSRSVANIEAHRKKFQVASL